MPVPSKFTWKICVPLTSNVIFTSGVQSGLASSGEVLVTFRWALPFAFMTKTSSLLPLPGRTNASHRRPTTQGCRPGSGSW